MSQVDLQDAKLFALDTYDKCAKCAGVIPVWRMRYKTCPWEIYDCVCMPCLMRLLREYPSIYALQYFGTERVPVKTREEALRDLVSRANRDTLRLLATAIACFLAIVWIILSIARSP